MQLREDLEEGGHRLAQVLLDHLLSDAKADEGDEADGFQTQDRPGLGSAWEPGKSLLSSPAPHTVGLAQNLSKAVSQRCYKTNWSKPEEETEA